VYVDWVEATALYVYLWVGGVTKYTILVEAVAGGNHARRRYLRTTMPPVGYQRATVDTRRCRQRVISQPSTILATKATIAFVRATLAVSRFVIETISNPLLPKPIAGLRTREGVVEMVSTLLDLLNAGERLSSYIGLPKRLGCPAFDPDRLCCLHGMCCVEACLIDCYLRDSSVYIHTRVAVRATSATPLPMWGVEGSGIVR
jgi:hypothetical protein